MFFRRASSVAGVLVVAALACGQVDARTAEEFYSGNTVRIIIPAGMGGSFGQYGQILARYFGKHIPGQPTLITQSMPGAGGLSALRYAYNVAPKDGSVLIIPHTSVVFESIFHSDARFEANKFQYIGRLANAGFVGLVHRRTGIKSIEEARTKEFIFGATGPANTLAIAPMMFNRMAGAKIKIITGYPGLSNVFQAVEQGELDGAATTVVNPSYLELLKKWQANEETDYMPIFTTVHGRVPELPNVPAISEFDASDRDRRLYEVVTADGLVGRSLAFPPGVSANYVEALRKAFDAMVRDPEFIANTSGRGIPISILGGEEMTTAINDLITSLSPERRAEIAETYEEVVSAIKRK